MTIVERIDSLLRNKNLSRRQLAKIAGIPTSSLQSAMERGKNFSLEMLQKIADALNVPLGALTISEEEAQKIASKIGVEPNLIIETWLTPQELERIHESAGSVTDERQAAIEEKRLDNLICRKAKQLNIAGKQKLVEHADLLIGNAEYKKNEPPKNE
ncbi:helix-turn-helix transcriptional regulator [Zongyangia sp. HA2173]|uniref:helix-turn-helix domain-containing protein n=1 Tax=Zongyangia sp. HA2173 TaxID=3133035 RepID=UPI003163B835